MWVWVSRSIISHAKLSSISPLPKNKSGIRRETVRKTKGSVILRKERVALWVILSVHPKKPGNEEKIAGNS